MKGLDIPIGGFQKQSLIDYPGMISSVIFTSGCNFRCRYCHNANLVYPELIKAGEKLNSTKILGYIEKNAKLLDAVVVTGGEPTIYKKLSLFIAMIKAYGLKVKLDTNGTNPEMLEYLIRNRLIDYVAMDIKAKLEFEAYKKVVGKIFTEQDFEKVKESIHILNETKLPHEYRTTLDSSIRTDHIISNIKKLNGKYFLQQLRKNGILQSLSIDKNLLQNETAHEKNIELHYR